MINFSVDNKPFNMVAVWYHYIRDFKAAYTYSLEISLDELEIISLVERYAGCGIGDLELSSRIILKDEERGSLGLIWNVLVLVKKKGKLLNEASGIIWTLNYIQQIEISNNFLYIIGGASESALENDKFEKVR